MSLRRFARRPRSARRRKDVVRLVVRSRAGELAELSWRSASALNLPARQRVTSGRGDPPTRSPRCPASPSRWPSSPYPAGDRVAIITNASGGIVARMPAPPESSPRAPSISPQSSLPTPNTGRPRDRLVATASMRTTAKTLAASSEAPVDAIMVICSSVAPRRRTRRRSAMVAATTLLPDRGCSCGRESTGSSLPTRPPCPVISFQKRQRKRSPCPRSTGGGDLVPRG